MADIFIRDVCNEAPGITQDEQAMAYKFLRNRKRGLAEIIKSHKTEFKGIGSWELFS